MEASNQSVGSRPADASPPPGRTKRLAFWLLMIVLMYAVMEILLFAAMSLRFGRMFSFSAMEAARREVSAGSDPFGLADVPARLRIHKEVVHPYMGYVYDPSVEQSSPYGISDVSPVQRRSPDKVIVGIFGGSFADDIAYNMAQKLADLLKPRFPGKEFVIVKATIGGYKQPQQLMALNYFTAIGGEFDIVINLDGFNDVALPALENVPQTSPFFPRQWHLRMRTVPDQEFLTTVGRIKFIDSVAETWASTFRRAPLRYSVTMNTLWRVGDRFLYNAGTNARAQLPQLASGTNEYAAAGPPTPFANQGEMYAALARTWAESSYQMHAVASAKGIRYFHFLQPNQYIDGTKPMSDEERGVAINEAHPYAKSVRSGYPELRARGRELVQRGVNFVDLTTLYANTREVLYRDNCCHVNPAGQRLVIEAIAKTITSALDGQK
jgi:hypothetical protein